MHGESNRCHHASVQSHVLLYNLQSQDQKVHGLQGTGRRQDQHSKGRVIKTDFVITSHEGEVRVANFAKFQLSWGRIFPELQLFAQAKF